MVKATIYFLTLFLIIILIFFAVSGLKSKKNNEGNRLTTEETPQKTGNPNNGINNKIDNQANINEKILATLKKEDLPKDVANLKLTKLDVPVFKQEYIRSCEEASLRMVLGFYGLQTNDMEIVKRVGYDPHPWDKKNNIWDDPDKMFVGSIDDSSKNGYGAFAQAIAPAAKTFGRDSESYFGVSEQFLAEQIYSGHPVIVWGFFNSPPFVKYFWNTKDGKKITAYRGEHTRVVVGVYGDETKPVGFLVDDPLTGEKEQYWSVGRLMTQMNMFGNLTNQAVVVR
jgi:uncharacterized protein YvpB